MPRRERPPSTAGNSNHSSFVAQTQEALPIRTPRVPQQGEEAGPSETASGEANPVEIQGKNSLHKFRNALRTNYDKVYNFCRELDSDYDGKISHDEFLQVLMSAEVGLSNDEAQQALRFASKNTREGVDYQNVVIRFLFGDLDRRITSQLHQQMIDNEKWKGDAATERLKGKFPAMRKFRKDIIMNYDRVRELFRNAPVGPSETLPRPVLKESLKGILPSMADVPEVELDAMLDIIDPNRDSDIAFEHFMNLCRQSDESYVNRLPIPSLRRSMPGAPWSHQAPWTAPLSYRSQLDTLRSLNSSRFVDKSQWMPRSPIPSRFQHTPRVNTSGLVQPSPGAPSHFDEQDRFQTMNQTNAQPISIESRELKKMRQEAKLERMRHNEARVLQTYDKETQIKLDKEAERVRLLALHQAVYRKGVARLRKGREGANGRGNLGVSAQLRGASVGLTTQILASKMTQP